jgi:hypothetical protein
MAVQLEQLTLATLEVLEPKIELLFQKHLQLITNDCMNRPGEKKKRKLTFQLEFEPVADPETGQCEEVKVSIDANAAVPKFRTRDFKMRPSKAGLRFDAQVADDPALA